MKPRRLDAPARVGNTIFHPGCSEESVVERAKREYLYHLKRMRDGSWVQPQKSTYRFMTSMPERIGDIAEIMVDPHSVSHFDGMRLWPARRIRVIFLEADDGSTWLVQVRNAGS